MTKDIQVSPKQVYVTMAGSMYVDDAADFRENIIDLLAQGHKNFIFDLNKVDYIDSAGLGVVVALHKKAAQAGGLVTIRGLHGVVKDLFELTRLTQVLHIEE